MAGLDRCLLPDARRFITGANVHLVKTWIFCYETSIQDSPRRKRYEQLIREFVAMEKRLLGIRIQAELARDRGMDLHRSSIALEEKIRRGL
jgi:hypothetical protein